MESCHTAHLWWPVDTLPSLPHPFHVMLGTLYLDLCQERVSCRETGLDPIQDVNRQVRLPIQITNEQLFYFLKIKMCSYYPLVYNGVELIQHVYQVMKWINLIILCLICKCFAIYLGKIFITKPGWGSFAIHCGIGSSVSSQTLLKTCLLKFLNKDQSLHYKKV